MTARHERSRRDRPRRGRAWWLVVAVGAAVLAAAVTQVVSALPAAARGALVVAALPYWSIGSGAATVLSNRREFSQVSPWIYGLTSGGQITPAYDPGQAAVVTARIAALRAAGLPIVPTLADTTDGNWSPQVVSRILADPAATAAHIAAIVALARRQGYAGIDIDYENLPAADRQPFSAFVTRLAAALHAAGKVLSVAVFARVTDAGTAPGSLAQDYAAIGAAADQVRVMAYDYHWDASPPGPVAPVSWVRQVLGYARSRIPASKIILGIPLYGYDWTGGTGTPVGPLAAAGLAARYRAEVRYASQSQAPWFTYTSGSGQRHEVWFENPASSLAKFKIARAAGIGGVFLWMYGAADHRTWPALRQVLPAATAGAAALRGTP